MKKLTLALVCVCNIGFAQILSDEVKSPSSTEIQTPKGEVKAKTVKPKITREVIIKKENKPVVAQKSKKGQKSILHIVADKETLYSLLKKYKTSEADFLKDNPGFDKTMPMKPGSKLFFIPSAEIKPVLAQKKPLEDKKVETIKQTDLAKTAKTPDKNPLDAKKAIESKKTVIAQKPIIVTDKKNTEIKGGIPVQKTTEKATANQTKPTVAPLNDANYHVVQAHETIFALAKKYDLDITELVEANDLTDNVIKPGQKLLINKLEMKKAKAAFDKKNEPVYVQKITGKKITEEGVAQVVQTKNRTHKFLALHRTAKRGSIVKVTNEANGTAIFAKIVGNLNPVGPDQKIMLKLSPLAYYQLKPKDSKMRAKIEYYSPM
jgi:LysM repeat protein